MSLQRLPDDWRPDWRDRHSYPHPTESVTFWRWEFLRRDPEYQADYAASLPADAEKLASRHLFGEGLREPPAELTEKYGLEFLPDPIRDLPPGLEMVRNWRDRGPLDDDELAVYQEAGFFPVMFDLSLPLDEQFEEMKPMLERAAKRRGLSADRSHKAMWRTYLRFMDAEAVGVKPAHAMKVLLPDLEADKRECAAIKGKARDPQVSRSRPTDLAKNWRKAIADLQKRFRAGWRARD
jgi:hypothetical protein